RHTRFSRDWSSDVCSSDLTTQVLLGCLALAGAWILDFALWQDAGIDPEASAQGALIMAFLSLEGFLVGVAVLMGAYLALRTSRKIGRASCRERGECWEASG